MFLSYAVLLRRLFRLEILYAASNAWNINWLINVLIAKNSMHANTDLKLLKQKLYTMRNINAFIFREWTYSYHAQRIK